MAEYNALILNAVFYAKRNPHERNCRVPTVLPLFLNREAATLTGYLFDGGFGIITERVTPTPPAPGARVPRAAPLEYDWVKNN
jgi:hypothetical protein